MGCVVPEYPKLHEAASIGDVNLIKAELSKNPDINAQFYGTTPLIVASIRGNLNAVKYLVEQGADINYVNSTYGSSALNEASVMNQYDVVAYLISKGANVEQKYANSSAILEPYRGKSALEIATNKGDQKMIAILKNKKLEEVSNKLDNKEEINVKNTNATSSWK